MDEIGRLRSLLWAILGIQRPEGDPARDASPTVQIDRLARYRCKVVARSNDGATVDLEPENPAVERRQNVPLLRGVPGVTAIVEPGSIVWLGWEAGDDAKPRAVPDWETATVQTLTIAATTGITIDCPGGTVDINGTSITCGPVGSIPVLVDGSVDSMGIKVKQLPTCTNALKAG